MHGHTVRSVFCFPFSSFFFLFLFFFFFFFFLGGGGSFYPMIRGKIRICVSPDIS